MGHLIHVEKDSQGNITETPYGSTSNEASMVLMNDNTSVQNKVMTMVSQIASLQSQMNSTLTAPASAIQNQVLAFNGADWEPTYVVEADNCNAWSSTTTYSVNDTCICDGKDWKSITNGNLGNRPTEGSNWNQLTLSLVAGDLQDAPTGDAFDKTKAYSAGDYCVYNNVFYKANRSISAGIDFTPAYWDATTVGNEITTLNSNNILSTTEKVVGEYYDGRPIYRRTFTGVHNAYTQSGNRRVHLNVVATGVDMALSASGYVTYIDPNSDTFKLPVGVCAVDTALLVQYTSLVNTSNGNLNLVFITNQYLSGTGQPFAVIVDYIKMS